MNTLWKLRGNLLKFPLSLEHFWLFCYWLFWFVWLFGITNLEEKNLEFQIIWKERYLLEIKILKLLEVVQGVLKILTSIKKLQWAIYRYVNLAQYGITGCGVFKAGIQNWKGFWIKINYSQRKLLNFENWIFSSSLEGWMLRIW